MSEYIVCVDDLEEPYYRYTDIKPETVFGHRLREKIVRCRDCKYLVDDDSMWVCDGFCANIGFNDGTPPDGFCAWAERRQA